MKLNYSIRDVLLVTAVVAIAVGWWLDHGRLSSRVEYLSKRAEYAESEMNAISEPALEKITLPNGEVRYR
jgi:hypothetical protein